MIAWAQHVCACAYYCILCVHAQSKRELQRDQRLSEVTFTQRGVLMKLKSQYIKWEDWDFQKGDGIQFSMIL